MLISRFFLVQLANSSMAAFLSKERTSLLLGRSERVDLQALRDVALGAREAASGKEGNVASAEALSSSVQDLLSLLLVLVDTLLFILMVSQSCEHTELPVFLK